MGDAAEMVLPWGAYRGWSVRAVPEGYLRWLVENCDLPAEVLRTACGRLGLDPADYPCVADVRSSYRPMVRAVLRAADLLAPEAFVDRTPSDYAGDPEAMGRLADVVGSLAGVHLVAARHGAVVVSPSPRTSGRWRQGLLSDAP